MKPEQLAYLAGLIDGEGCIECSSLHFIQLRISMATNEPLQTVSGWIGAKLATYPSRGHHHRPQCRLVLTGDRACALLEEVFPYLLLKKDQARAALEIEELRQRARKYIGRRHRPGRGGSLPFPEELRAEMEALRLKLKVLKRGNLVAPDSRAHQLEWSA